MPNVRYPTLNFRGLHEMELAHLRISHGDGVDINDVDKVKIRI